MIEHAARLAHASQGDVGEDGAEAHGQEEQRLELPADGQIEEQKTDTDHEQAAEPIRPGAVGREQEGVQPG